MTPGFADDASDVDSRKRMAPSPTSSIKTSSSENKNKKSKSGLKSSPSGGSEKSANRGLRHFSMMVCQKVEEKGTTTYNEVADELVKKVIAEREGEQGTPSGGGKFDEKNIRRRVYDALNVLMAMDIISKEKKEITWNGLPSIGGQQDLDSMREEINFRQTQLQQKRESLRELLVQQVCFRNLAWLNHQRGPSEEKIPLPFIVVNTHATAVIQCDMSRDRTNVMFDFSMPFEVNDDNFLLKEMGMDKTSMSVIREMLPEDVMDYCCEHRLLDGLVSSEPGHRERTPPPPVGRSHSHPPPPTPHSHSHPPPHSHSHPPPPPPHSHSSYPPPPHSHRHPGHHPPSHMYYHPPPSRYSYEGM